LGSTAIGGYLRPRHVAVGRCLYFVLCLIVFAPLFPAAQRPRACWTRANAQHDDRHTLGSNTARLDWKVGGEGQWGSRSTRPAVEIHAHAAGLGERRQEVQRPQRRRQRVAHLFVFGLCFGAHR
jgi:hypothetical protein